jgi:hypothetical protein
MLRSKELVSFQPKADVTGIAANGVHYPQIGTITESALAKYSEKLSKFFPFAFLPRSHCSIVHKISHISKELVPYIRG